MNARLIYSGIVILFSICPCTAMAQSEAPPAPALQVQRWHPHDFVFHSDAKAENPFAVPFSAEVTGPGDVRFSMPGFFDGDGTWKVRISPTAEGRWSIITRSTLPSLDGRRTSLDCIPNTAARIHGGLRIDPKHPRHFVFEDGGRYFLMGYECDWLWALDMGKPELKTLDAFLDKLATNGFNYLILNAYAHDTAWRKGKTGDDDYGPPPTYAWEGSNEKPDHSRFNLAYWKHYDRVIDALCQRGMIAHVMIKVYNKMVNSPAKGSAEDDLFFRWMIARYAAYPNINWDFSKEANNEKDLDYKKDRLLFLRRNDPYRRPITVHDDHATYDRGMYNDLLDYRSDQQHSKWLPTLLEHRQQRLWPVVNVEFGYEPGPKGLNDKTYGVVQPPEEVCRRAWEVYMAGGYGAYYYTYTAWDVLRPEDTPRGYAYFKHLREFFEGTSYWRMEPADGLVSDGYCLADRGQEYVVFLNKSQPFSLKLEDLAAPARAEWFHPLTGERQQAGMVAKGTVRLTPPPNWGDAAVVLHVGSPSRQAAAPGGTSQTFDKQTSHVWEKVEITLRAQKTCDNPYTDLTVWVDLKGPGFSKRCYGFWDGQDLYRVRVMPTAPGTWTWKSGSHPADGGLDGVSGSFTAVAWTDSEKAANPNRRGMIRPNANGHALQYADGTPYFLLGDTWWATPTFRFRWRDDDTLRPLGPEAGFREFVAYRRAQEFNCVAIIAALPNWANDDKPASLKMPDGTVLRSAWRQAGTNSAKSMTDEAGHRAFLFPGKVPGYEQDFPDLQRINPAYFQSLDRKIDYLNSQGVVPFIEVARRDIGQAWKKYYPWPQSYTRYIQYVWSRYQANVCLFSPIHFDSSGDTIPAADWNAAANAVIDAYGLPPFGTLAGTNPDASSLRNWGHVDKAKWLGFHQIGNRRTHDSFALLSEIFQTAPAVPAINGEPYYDGMENAEGGTELAGLYCRSAMYGSVLSGGLGGHIYGAGGWEGGVWSGEVEEASKWPMWKVFQWPAAGQMRHLKAFMLSEGPRYQELIPCTDQISPNQSAKPKGTTGWAYAAGTPQGDLFMLYFEKDCPQATLAKAQSGATYRAQWFDTRTGRWSDAGSEPISSDASGRIALPRFPGDEAMSQTDWALKLKR